MKERDAFKQLQ